MLVSEIIMSVTFNLLRCNDNEGKKKRQIIEDACNWKGALKMTEKKVPYIHFSFSGWFTTQTGRMGIYLWAPFLSNQQSKKQL